VQSCSCFSCSVGYGDRWLPLHHDAVVIIFMLIEGLLLCLLMIPLLPQLIVTCCCTMLFWCHFTFLVQCPCFLQFSCHQFWWTALDGCSTTYPQCYCATAFTVRCPWAMLLPSPSLIACTSLLCHFTLHHYCTTVASLLQQPPLNCFLYDHCHHWCWYYYHCLFVVVIFCVNKPKNRKVWKMST